MVQQPPVGQGLLSIEDHNYTDTPHLVGLLWSSYQPDAEISGNSQHYKKQTSTQWDSNLQSQQASSSGTLESLVFWCPRQQKIGPSISKITNSQGIKLFIEFPFIWHHLKFIECRK